MGGKILRISGWICCHVHAGNRCYRLVLFLKLIIPQSNLPICTANCIFEDTKDCDNHDDSQAMSIKLG